MNKKLSLKRFKPATASVKATVEDLLSRGAVLIDVKETAVRVLRQQSVASIDCFGRVVWSVASREDVERSR